MRLVLSRAESQQVDELGRICYDAFKEIDERHRFPLDFPSVEFACQAIARFVSRPDYYAVAASVEGELVGSNFLSLSDGIAGVGPVSVDPAHQGKGIGRALMEDVLSHARRQHIARVRLLQDGFNTGSLSLYASLGFVVREAAAVMEAVSAAEPDGTIRPLTEADLRAVERISARIYQSSRRNEAAAAITYGLKPLLRERDGRPTGYYIPSMLGHGVAASEDDALALTAEAARQAPSGITLFLCPLSEATLYQHALRAGYRTVKVMNLMSVGPYDAPDGVWLPSVLY